MRISAAVALPFVLIIPATALAIPRSDDVRARVEARLEPAVQVRGRPVVVHTLTQEMATHHVPAITVAVVDSGKIAWAKAYGMADVAAGRRATTRTAFQAGSISKPVAASAALQLVQEGVLTLDAPANSQLRSWTIPASPLAAERPVTLREILGHTAGVTVHGFPGYPAGAPLPTVVQVLNGRPPANTGPVVIQTQPGSKWSYSGGGFTIAQLMMTDVTEQPFPVLMQDRVLGPLAMTDSTYEQPPPPSRAATFATGYLSDGRPVAGRFHTYPEEAAAGLWTTPTDLARWIIALNDAYEGTSARLMQPTTARAMLTEGLGHWGLGVEVGGTGEDFHYTHDGDDWGFKAVFMAWPKGGRGIIVMANGDDGLPVIQELMQAVAREYGWGGAEATVLVPLSLGQSRIEEMVGSYGNGQAVLNAQLGKLWLGNGADRYEVLASLDGTLMIDAGDVAVPMRVMRSKEGHVKAIVAGGRPLVRDSAPVSPD